MTHSRFSCPNKVDECSIAEAFNMTLLSDTARARQCAFQRLLGAAERGDIDSGHMSALQMAYNYYRYNDSNAIKVMQGLLRRSCKSKACYIRGLDLLEQIDRNQLVIDDYVSGPCMDYYHHKRAKNYKCSICGAIGVNILSCPGNPSALNVRPSLHLYQVQDEPTPVPSLEEFPPLAAATTAAAAAASAASAATAAASSATGSTGPVLSADEQIHNFLLKMGWKYQSNHDAYFFPAPEFPCVYLKLDQTPLDLVLRSATWYDQKRSYKHLIPYINSLVIQSHTHDLYIIRPGSGSNTEINIAAAKEFIASQRDGTDTWINISVLMDQLR